MKDYKDFNFEENLKTHKRTDTACIIYTSGTGGQSKRSYVKSWGNASKLFWSSRIIKKFKLKI